MIKKRFLWLLLFAALIMSGSALMAQAPAGPEKAMIYNGEQLKIQLTGDIRLNMTQNNFNVYNDTYGELWVNNQKYGFPIFSYAGEGPYSLKGTQAIWLPYQAALKRGSLIFDVRYSQLGLTITGPGVLGGTTFGRFETDFYGGFGAASGTVSRQPILRLRLAYAGLQWGGLSKGMWEAKITFGQYTTLVCPVLAAPVSLSPLPFFAKGVLFDWDQGIMASFLFGTPKANVMIDADVTRAKAGNDGSSALYGGEGILAPAVNDERGIGEATMHPAFHGRLAFNLNPADIFGLMVALDGHYYTMQTPLAFANTAFYGINIAAAIPGFTKTSVVPSKSVGAQAKVSVWIFTIQGAGWMGQNMLQFTGSNFGTGYREGFTGLKNMADKGRGGYATLIVMGPKIGIPVMLYFQMGQELKYNNHRIPNATAAGISSTATYALSTLGGATSSILTNSEVSGGLQIFVNQYVKIGYEVGQVDTHFKGVKGSSADIVHRAQANFTF